MSAEQPGDVAYFILDGTVKVHVEQAEESDVILAILGRGEIVGELSIIDTPTRSATVVTLEQSTLCWIGREEFRNLLHAVPQLSSNLHRVLARPLRLANAYIQALPTKDIFGRVACQILSFAHEYGERLPNQDILVPLRLTQTDLASLVRASRVRVNHVLAFYKERHFVSINQRFHITVHDAAGLARRCE